MTGLMWSTSNDLSPIRYNGRKIISLLNVLVLQISYSKPSKKEFIEIVIELARRVGLTMTDEELCAEANKWEMRHGGYFRTYGTAVYQLPAGYSGDLRCCIGLRTAHWPLAVKISWSIFDFEIKGRERIAITGPNGSGKQRFCG